MGSQAERAEIRAHLPWNFTWGALSADTVGFGPVFAVAMVAGVLRLGVLKRLEEIERGVKHA